MTFKRISTLVLTFVMLAMAVMQGGISVFASADDASDAAYYSTDGYVAKIDNESATLKALPTGYKDGVHIANSSDEYILEEDGNKYQWIGRYYYKKATGTSATVYTKGNETVFGESGEYVIQSRMRFTQNEDYAMFSALQWQCKDSEYTDAAKTYTFNFRMNNVNTLDDAAETIEFRVDNGGSNVKRIQNLASIVLKNDVWYTVRYSYNLDNLTARMDITDEDGNVTSTGDFNLPTSASYSYAGMKYYRIRADVGEKTLSGFGIDDFTIAKTTHKPLSVDYDEEMGTVTLDGKAVESGKDIPVAYNSDAASNLKITAKEGCAIKSVTINGEAQAASGNEAAVELKNVKTAVSVEASFTKLDEVKKYDLTVTAAKHGKVTVNGEDVDKSFVKSDITEGSGLEIKVEPDDGYEAKVTVNGVQKTLTDGMLAVVISEDTDVVITYTVEKYSKLLFVDNEESGIKALPTGYQDGVHIANSADEYILQEDNGNKYNWIGRYYYKKATGTSATVYTKGNETVFGESGEYVIQSRMRFTQNEDYAMFEALQWQCKDSEYTEAAKTYTFNFRMNNVNTLDEALYCKGWYSYHT